MVKILIDNVWLRPLVITCVAFSVLLTSGCGGCRDQDPADQTAKKKAEQEKEKKKKKKKPDFETLNPVLLPGHFDTKKPDQDKDTDNSEKNPLKLAVDNLRSPAVSKNRVKPGHWYTTNFQAIANNFNTQGELTSVCIDGVGQPVRIPVTDYFATTNRPVALPKGEWKNFESSVFLPLRDKAFTAASVSYQVRPGRGGFTQINRPHSTSVMLPSQYHLVLLSDQPDGYKYLDLADCISLRVNTRNANASRFYYVVPTVPGKPLPLPRHALNWTTIAYLIWDDFDPNELEPEHQQAILDWIHFGGQLIVSGPDSLDKLQNSFLGDYLPAHFEAARNITNADLEELNRNWSVPAKAGKSNKRALVISDQVPLLGVEFKPHDAANFVEGTGEMAIERQLGRGRIVVTAFSLDAPAVVSGWGSFESFLNGALLRKPSRKFGSTGYDEVVFEWKNNGTSLFDPMLNSTLRFLSRDLSVAGTGTVSETANFDDAENQRGYLLDTADVDTEFRPEASIHRSKHRNLDDHWHYGGYQDVAQAGTGGWNDNSGISSAARESLKEAAGIAPPSSTFVLKMLAAYLVVLVPVNWLIFRSIGRVEYAWVAAPLIAVIGAVLVVRMASLDIGFVRSNTQVGLLEIYADYPRAHVAEYSALYTSLSTRYQADLDNPTAQSLPFGRAADASLFVSSERASEVELRRTVNNRLDGIQIQSNSTGLIHTEYMFDLGGVVSFAAPRVNQVSKVSNGTSVSLSDVAVLGRDQDGNLMSAWVGDLDVDSNAELKFAPIEEGSMGQLWRDKPRFQNTKRVATTIWEKNLRQPNPKFGASSKVDEPEFISPGSATIEVIEGFPELKSQWNRYRPLLFQAAAEASRRDELDAGGDPSADETTVTRYQFEKIYQLINGSTTVRLGRVLDRVLTNLVLAPGEFRLIAATNQRLGKTTFVPASTQVNQQTLVVVHLKRPSLPTASRDVNAYEDFTVRSSIDFERESNTP